MAYNAPELLLVGAAQNLVLATSPEPELKDDLQCVEDFPADIDGPEYEGTQAW